MSSEKTTNLQLNKWVPTDYVKMDEFNENFDIIDDTIGILNKRNDGFISILEDSSIVANGITDDTTAFIDFCTNAKNSNKSVYIPKGKTIRINTANQRIPDVRIFGEGALQIDAYTFADNIKFEGLDVKLNNIIDCNAVDGYIRNCNLIGSNINNGGFVIWNPTNTIITENKMNDCNGFTLKGAKNCKIISNRLYRTLYGIRIEGGSRNIVGFNEIEGASGSLTGIGFIGKYNNSDEDRRNTLSNVIIGNVLLGLFQECISLDCRANDTNQSHVNGLYTVTAHSYHNGSQGEYRTLTIDATGKSDDWANGYYAVFVTGKARGIAVKIVDSTPTQLVVRQGVNFYGLENLIVAGDKLVITTGAVFNTITGNNIRAYNSGGAIVLWGSAYCNTISNNSIYETNTGISINAVINVASDGSISDFALAGSITITGNTVYSRQQHLVMNVTNYGTGSININKIFEITVTGNEFMGYGEIYLNGLTTGDITSISFDNNKYLGAKLKFNYVDKVKIDKQDLTGDMFTNTTNVTRNTIENVTV